MNEVALKPNRTAFQVELVEGSSSFDYSGETSQDALGVYSLAGLSYFSASPNDTSRF